jgi:hypothetical protein
VAQRPTRVLSELMNADSIVWRAGWASLALAGLCLALSLVDSRQVSGVNTWIKPMKFSLSIGIYLLTVAFLLPLSPWSGQGWLRWSILGTLAATHALVLLQAARGVRSHFNVASAFDGGIFASMGFLITLHTVAMVVLLISFGRSDLPPALLWGIRLGLLSAIVGSLQGFSMTARLAHTVGAADGGPGLPVLNWSTVAGDLRVAHAIALHGLQVLPLAGWWISRAGVPRGALLVWLLFAAQMGLSGLLMLQALSGKPLIASTRTFGTLEKETA